MSCDKLLPYGIKKSSVKKETDKKMKILVLGDISRSSSCKYVCDRLWRYRKDNGIDFVVVNGENCAETNGIDKNSANMLFSAGADVITTGNHAFKRYEAKSLFEEERMLLRPANYPGSVPGEGAVLADAAGMTVLVINLLGVIMMEPLENPFFTVERILARYQGKYDISILDFHAEATSEKIALGRYFDGRIHVMFGTHTHVPTADEQILPRGSGYITDLGMVGAKESIVGADIAAVTERCRTKMGGRLKVATGEIVAEGALFTLDTSTKKVTSVTRVRF
jgi:metallophosphoesterase (TIGR00282 family)